MALYAQWHLSSTDPSDTKIGVMLLRLWYGTYRSVGPPYLLHSPSILHHVVKLSIPLLNDAVKSVGTVGSDAIPSARQVLRGEISCQFHLIIKGQYHHSMLTVEIRSCAVCIASCDNNSDELNTSFIFLGNGRKVGYEVSTNRGRKETNEGRKRKNTVFFSFYI
jgi:hypothetical protein